MKKKGKQDDLEKDLFESGNWTRIDEILKEVKQLYKRERSARAQQTNLLLGQKFLELRRLVTGTDEDFNPSHPLGANGEDSLKAISRVAASAVQRLIAVHRRGRRLRLSSRSQSSLSLRSGKK